jgi:hypothetical protein
MRRFLSNLICAALAGGFMAGFTSGVLAIALVFGG